jgi:hypothetical protein
LNVSRYNDKKPPAHACGGFGDLKLETKRLERLGDVAGTDAAGAGLDGPDATVCKGFHLLEVGIPDGTGLVVGMAHIIAEAGAFTTDFTFSRHITIPPLITERDFLADLVYGCKRKDKDPA